MHIPLKILIDNLYSMLSGRVYFDNNATTPLDKEVRSYMMKVEKKYFGNPSSMHLTGMLSREIIEDARTNVARLINARPDEIIFTSGATEANNTIIKGASELFPKGHFITSAVEHQSVLAVFQSLEKKGYKVTYLGKQKYGKVDIAELKDAIRDDTTLISIMHVNNETGTVNDIRQIAEIARSGNILFHSDVVQSFGKLEIDVKNIPADYLSFSAHKIYGPKGCGAIFVRSGSPFYPLIEGGHQESIMRAGTENLFNIAGFGKACQMMMKMNKAKYLDVLKMIRSEILDRITKIYPDMELNGDPDGFPSTLNIRFPGVLNNELISFLDYYNIAVSAGSACVAGSEEPSHVLLALGLTSEEASSSIRISIGKYNTLKDAGKLIKILKKFKKDSKDFFKYIFPDEFPEGKLIVDLREEKQLKEYPALPGAINIKPNLRELKKHLNKFPKEKEIILICEDGYISNYFAPLLRRAGWTNVKVMFGGYKRWRLYNRKYT